MLIDVKTLSATRNPDPATVQLATWGQYGIVLLLLCLIVYLGLTIYFLRKLRRHHLALWQSAGCPTLLKNNRALFALLFGKINDKLPNNLRDTAKILRYLTYAILLLMVVLVVIFYLISR